MRRQTSPAGWDAGDGSTGCLVVVGRQLDAMRGWRRGPHRWSRATGLLLVAVLLLLCAAPAGAVTVSLSVTRYLFDHGSGSGTSAFLMYSAVAGETSTTRVSFALHRFTVTDSTASLQAHAGCRQVDPRLVTCDEPRGTSISGALVRLGGGRNDFTLGEVHADRFLGAEVLLGLEVFGGPNGNRIDLSRATAAAQLHGGAGDDTLIGGQGDDLFMPGGGVNTIDGGGGVNTVSYADATGPVRASLAEGIGRAPGRVDHLTHIQNLNGSRFDDVLIGDDGPNALSGAGGNDILIGMGGNDTLDATGSLGLYPPGRVDLSGTPGRNVLIGGSGKTQFVAACGDTLVGGSGIGSFVAPGILPCSGLAQGRVTRIYCGSVSDTVLYPSSLVLVNGCRTLREVTADAEFVGTPPPPRLTRHWGAAWRIQCQSPPCRASLVLTVREAGRRTLVLGDTPTRTRPAGPRTIRVELTQFGYAYLLRHPDAVVRVALTTSTFFVPQRVTAYLVTARPQRAPYNADGTAR